MIELSERQRKDFLKRHLANALFDKLSRGGWHVVTSGESAKFRTLGAGRAPKNPYDSSTFLYAWLATVSPALPRFGFGRHAIMIDSLVYHEVLSQFAIHTRENWDRLLESGVRQLYRVENNTLRRNHVVHQLMCAIGDALIERLDGMKLIIPVKMELRDFQESDEQQLVLANLRYR